MRDRELDVLVVGGGPGGATLAANLARRGRRVLVLERDAFPRFHIGESLLPCSVQVFEELGLLPEIEARFLRKYGAVFIDGPTGHETRYPFAEAFKLRHAHAFQVPRDTFDLLLLDHARACGAEARHGWTVERMLVEDERAVGVVARDPGGARHEIRARLVADATGRDALRAHASRSQQKLPLLEQTLALYGQFRDVPRSEGLLGGDIRIVLSPACWFWLIPFADGRTSVGAVLEPSAIVKAQGRADVEATFAAVRDACEPMRRLLEHAEPLFPVRAIADFSYRVTEIAGDGWLAIGDAAGFIDPLFSTGVHLAVSGARLAAGHVDAALDAGDVSRGRWLAYERSQRRATEIFMGAVQAFYRGAFKSMLVAPGPQRKYLRRLITSILAGDVYHEEEPLWLRDFASRFPAEMPGQAAASA
jgi:flavin-dependent dehydrogenase